MPCKLGQDDVDKAVAFHGHECPGLWIGIRAAELCLEELGHNDATPVTVVVESDMCGVDAIQVLTGCTFGKGNLIHRDLGKLAFSFFRVSDGKSLRAILQPGITEAAREEMQELLRKESTGKATEIDEERIWLLRAMTCSRIREALLSDLFSVVRSTSPAPRPPRNLESLACSRCGESTMESRTRRLGGETYCIPCFEEVEQKR